MRGRENGVRVFALFVIAITVGYLIVDSLLWTKPPVSSQVFSGLKEELETTFSKLKEDVLTAQHNCATAKRVTADANEYIRTGLVKRISAKVEAEAKNMRLNESLDELLLEGGGSPLRTLLVGHWRSGSTFVGDLLQSHPATYYAFEPLMYYLGNQQVRGGPLIGKCNSALKAIFECRYKDLNSHPLNRYIREMWLFRYSRFLRECSALVDVCSDVEFLAKTCRLFPVQVVKTVRYRLDALSGLLQHKELSNLKVVYIIRDPRAIMNSRLRIPRDWCVQAPDCANATALCEDLKREFYLAQEMKAKYPDRFMILRYESMVKNYSDVASKLFQFLQMEMTNSTVEFLRTHTSIHSTDPLSTYREGKNMMHWMKDLDSNHTLLKHIQGVCTDAMKLWEYEPLKIGSSEVEDE